MVKKHLTIWGITLLALVVLLMGTVTFVRNDAKILVTGIKLWSVNDEITYYNSDPVKTDAKTESARDAFAYREALYTSDDFVVRTYSNMNVVAKVLGWLIALALIPGVIFVDLCLVAVYYDSVLSDYFKYCKKKIMKKWRAITKKFTSGTKKTTSKSNVVHMDGRNCHKPNNGSNTRAM